MLSKKQILDRLEHLLKFKGITNGNWYCDEIEILIRSASSPEKFKE